jgi:heme exporter protein C
MQADTRLRFESPAPRALRGSAALLGLLAAGWAASVLAAPLDSVQGVVQKILYLHVPCAFAAYTGFLVTGACSALYLWRGEARFDRIAAASAEVGLLFCTLVIVTGPIWAKGTWGHWWAWDPRLTVTLLQWFIYLAYLLLRSFTEGDERAARFAAVYGIVGLLAIPLNYFAIQLFGSAAMHPENLQRGSLGAGMGLPFLLGVLTGLAAYSNLLCLRTDSLEQRNVLQEQLEARGL